MLCLTRRAGEGMTLISAAAKTRINVACTTTEPCTCTLHFYGSIASVHDMNGAPVQVGRVNTAVTLSVDEFVTLEMDDRTEPVTIKHRERAHGSGVSIGIDAHPDVRIWRSETLATAHRVSGAAA